MDAFLPHQQPPDKGQRAGAAARSITIPCIRRGQITAVLAAVLKNPWKVENRPITNAQFARSTTAMPGTVVQFLDQED